MHHRLVAEARALGLPCFPCNADKTPMTKRGLYDATTDIESLSHLFSRAALIGVPTGEVTGFDVLDIDLQAKPWWGENKWRIPTTRTHRTRRGGLHLFFVHEPGRRNTAGRIARGVDRRAEGGSVIWWPAIGCPVISNAPFARWPRWLLDAQTPPVREVKGSTPCTDRYARAALHNAAQRVAQAVEGTRNHTLMRVSKADGSQTLDLQQDALDAAGVPERNLYSDTASGRRDDRPGLGACLKALRSGDTLVVWKLDRLGRNLRHLVNVVHDLTERDIGLRVLTGQGAAIDPTTAAGKLVFGIFAALAEFERELISERTRAGLAAARARGRKGGRKPKMTPAKVRLAAAAMGKKGTVVGDLCAELGITRATIYRYVSPTGELRCDGRKVVGM